MVKKKKYPKTYNEQATRIDNRLIVFSILLFIICFYSCDKTSKQSFPNDETKNSKSSADAFSSYIAKDFLKTNNSVDFYPPSALLQTLGADSGHTYVKESGFYDGISISEAKVVYYESINVIIFILDNKDEVFGYLEKTKSTDNDRIKLGESIEIAKNELGNSITKAKEDEYIAIGKYNDYLLKILFYTTNNIIKEIKVYPADI